MNLTFPISPEQIRKEMKNIIKRIQEETKWDLVRNLADITISMGDAPEYGPDFGVVRELDSIIFGSWLDQIVPSASWFNIFEFLIIRESFVLFFEEEILFGELAEIITSFLNLLTISFLRIEYDKKALENKLSSAKSRFLHKSKDVSDRERILFNKINELSSIIISQTLSFKLIKNTLLYYIDDIQYDELDYNDLFDYVIRYLSNSPEEIVSPIRLRNRSLEVLEKVVEYGFSGSVNQIAESLNLNPSTISRELNQFATRYNAKFRVEKNFYKLGLHYHQIIIRLEKNNDDVFAKLIDELKSIKYISEMYGGMGDKFRYIYCVILCPFIVAENLTFNLQKYEKNNLIINFEIKPTKNRIFKTTLIGSDFRPTINNYKKLLNGEISCVKLTTWDNSMFEEDISSKFNSNESKLLKFMSVYQSNGIVRYNDYKVFQAQLFDFLNDNGYDTKNVQECSAYMNKIRKILLDRNLIDFRLQLLPISLAENDRLVIKIICNPEDEKIISLLNRISIFSWIFIHIGYEDIIFSVYGLNHTHRISKLIFEEIKKNNLDYEYFSMALTVWRYVPLEKLYSYQDSKWFPR